MEFTDRVLIGRS